MPSGTKIICAMSGGVDSSVAALLLKQQGFEVIGVTMKLWDCFKAPHAKTCCSTSDTMDARRVCEQLQIPHHVVDVRSEFRRDVVEYFVDEYGRARTPNPCIRCNSKIKFELLRNECEKLFGVAKIATGHYAQIAKEADGTFSLRKGKDPKKDQSYFLFEMSQAALADTLFPVGGLEKNEVRKLADDAGLKTAKKGESQEVCFIPDNDYAGFIADFYPDRLKGSGDFVDKNGKVLGRHEGLHAYTIGQRRGIGFGLGKRRYVTELDTKNNRVVLGDNEDLFSKLVKISHLHFCNAPRATELLSATGGRVTAKIRYRTEAAAALFTRTGENSAELMFDQPQRAPTPGQAVVFYNGDEVLGGGWIVI